MKRICLTCSFYRLEDRYSGRCRVGRGAVPVDAYPLVRHEDSCGKWKDAGQNYYIRRGWLRKQAEKPAAGD